MISILSDKKGTVILLIVSFAVLISIFMLFGIDPSALTGREAYVGKLPLDLMKDLHSLSTENFLLEEKARIAEDLAIQDLQNLSLCEDEGRNVLDFSGCYPSSEKVEEEFTKRFIFHLFALGETFKPNEIIIREGKIIGIQEPQILPQGEYAITHQKRFVIPAMDFSVFENVVRALDQECVRNALDSPQKIETCVGNRFTVQDSIKYLNIDFLTTHMMGDVGEFMHIRFSIAKDVLKQEGKLF